LDLFLVGAPLAFHLMNEIWTGFDELNREM
jgi:hypothetical protein